MVCIVEEDAEDSRLLSGIRNQLEWLFNDLPWSQIVDVLCENRVLVTTGRDSFAYHYIRQRYETQNEHCRRLMNYVLGKFSYASFNVFLEGLWSVYPHGSPRRPPWVDAMERGEGTRPCQKQSSGFLLGMF